MIPSNPYKPFTLYRFEHELVLTTKSGEIHKIYVLDPVTNFYNNSTWVPAVYPFNPKEVTDFYVDYLSGFHISKKSVETINFLNRRIYKKYRIVPRRQVSREIGLFKDYLMYHDVKFFIEEMEVKE